MRQLQSFVSKTRKCEQETAKREEKRHTGQEVCDGEDA